MQLINIHKLKKALIKKLGGYTKEDISFPSQPIYRSEKCEIIKTAARVGVSRLAPIDPQAIEDNLKSELAEIVIKHARRHDFFDKEGLMHIFVAEILIGVRK